MSRNYENLRNSEENLSKIFEKFFRHSIKIHRTTLKAIDALIEKNNEKAEEYFVQIDKEEFESNQFEANIIDEAVWIISKDQPLANHLRFLIAIISSSSDLERICDYAKNISKFLKFNYHSDQYYLENLKSLHTNVFKKYFEIFEKFKATDPNHVLEFALSKKESFERKYIQNIKIVTQRLTLENQQDYLYNFIIALKNVERILDHQINIIEKFIYIKRGAFIIEKTDLGSK
ncbi:phosphate transport system protein [Mycoplasma testudineum]|uniref:Phosphate transport system protein n=1 Tax=Mycoplasma testudineum TaxID=244584 RepID=A0A4R6IDZ8_9MOLU|nr:phosphate signaling complex protein PhoU [Mycoplasma testudineum]OYD26679.1 phosphate transport system regulatory protein PhoU [Mycoplasma testudineum]TDO19808.1 phosphate transport system protein [Mycoplasma testudineum]